MGSLRTLLLPALLGAAALLLTAQAPGEAVEVYWKGRWYPARVLQAKASQWFIAYDGYGANWNEWVGQDRIRSLWAVGSPIDVLWKRSWYRATILAVRPGAYRIHYDGYGPEWDEWVTPSRMRRRR